MTKLRPRIVHHISTSPPRTMPIYHATKVVEVTVTDRHLGALSLRMILLGVHPRFWGILTVNGMRARGLLSDRRPNVPARKERIYPVGVMRATRLGRDRPSTFIKIERSGIITGTSVGFGARNPG